MVSRSRSWCLTDFDLNPDWWIAQQAVATYTLYGREVCPDTQRVHNQGMIYFKTKKTLANVKLLHPTFHWEPTRNNTASITYCKKDGEVTEWGDAPTQGKRSDFDDVYEAIQDGADYRAVLEANPRIAITCVQGIKQAIVAQVKHREQDVAPMVKWYWGATATGKSRQAFSEAGADAYVFCKTGKFWEGYTGQTNVIFDDFRPDQIPFAIFLSVLDRYRVTVEVKGGSCPLAATKFWITSPKDPSATYTALNHNTGRTWTTENVNQLVRRCDEIKRFGVAEVWPVFNFLDEVAIDFEAAV